MGRSEIVQRRPTLGPREILHENPYYVLYRQLADFGEFTKEYFVTHYHGVRVSVIVERAGDILLCRQYRLLLDGISWELPGGSAQAGETMEAAASRECFEETGVRCSNLKPLIRFQHGLDTLDGLTQVFYTTDFTELAKGQEDHETEAPVWMSLNRCIEMIFSTQLVDCLFTTAFLAYHTMKHSLKGAGHDGRPS